MCGLVKKPLSFIAVFNNDISTVFAMQSYSNLDIFLLACKYTFCYNIKVALWRKVDFCYC